MFDNKKDAEEHDKMLELALNITALIERHIDGIAEEAGEEIGLLLARRRDVLAKACKGKPELLLEAQEDDGKNEVKGDAGGAGKATDEAVTPLAANA